MCGARVCAADTDFCAELVAYWIYFAITPKGKRMAARKIGLAEYLLSDDAAAAEHWQLKTLASLQRGLGEVSQATYEHLRAAIAADVKAPVATAAPELLGVTSDRRRR